MNAVETEPLAADPKRVIEAPYDCLWIVLKDRRKPFPLEGEPLQWVDWKLRGQISRLLVDGHLKQKGVTYLPTFGKVPTPLIAIDTHGADLASSIESTAKGMKLKNLLCYFEDEAAFSEGGKDLKRLEGLEFPSHLVLAHGRSDKATP